MELPSQRQCDAGGRAPQRGAASHAVRRQRELPLHVQVIVVAAWGSGLEALPGCPLPAGNTSTPLPPAPVPLCFCNCVADTCLAIFLTTHSFRDLTFTGGEEGALPRWCMGRPKHVC